MPREYFPLSKATLLEIEWDSSSTEQADTKKITYFVIPFYMTYIIRVDKSMETEHR